MSKIKSAWEIALEKTEDIVIDEEKYQAQLSEKAGMALAGRFLNNLEMTAEELGMGLAEADENQRQGAVKTALSNLILPNDDMYEMRFERTAQLFAAISGNDASVMDLINQIGEFFKQFISARNEFEKRMTEQINKAMQEDPEHVNTAQYSRIIEEKLRQMDAQYSAALADSKAQLTDLLHFAQ